MTDLIDWASFFFLFLVSAISECAHLEDHQHMCFLVNSKHIFLICLENTMTLGFDINLCYLEVQ